MHVGLGCSRNESVKSDLSLTALIIHTCVLFLQCWNKWPKYLPYVFPVSERQHTQVHHVPGCAVVVAHQVEGHGNVGMAVIKAQIVLQQKVNK